MGAGKLKHEERQERILFALRLITTTGRTRGVAILVKAEYECSIQTAQRIVRSAVALVAAGMPKMVDTVRTRAVLILDKMIDDEKETNEGIRASLKILIDLLGLAAPKRLQIDTPGEVFDPLAIYASSPELMERALLLERDAYDASQNETVGAVDVGEAGVPGAGAVAVPPPLAEVGRGGDEAADRSELQPPDSPDPD